MLIASSHAAMPRAAFIHILMYTTVSSSYEYSEGVTRDDPLP